ncbi:MAG: metallophosphoesterase family protein [Candidatus Hodarchaeales archaeon]
MKAVHILALSDIHGNVKATKDLVEHINAKNYDIDLIIVAGDLPATTSLSVMAQYMISHPFNALSKKGFTHWVYKGKGRQNFVKKQISSINKIISLFSFLEAPIIYIPGNVDSYEALQFIKDQQKPKIHILDSNPYEGQGLMIIGTGGAIIPPFYSEPICDHEYHLKAYEDKWDNFTKRGIDKKIDILVTHEPPQFEVEINDRNIIKGGSQKVSAIIRELNPRLVIFGHYHEFSLTKTSDEITYVNPGPLACYHFATINLTLEKVEVSLNKLSPAKLDSINKIYSNRTVENVLHRTIRFV